MRCEVYIIMVFFSQYNGVPYSWICCWQGWRFTSSEKHTPNSSNVTVE